MATGINIDPNISLGVKPPAAMSLSEMLNLARGAQQYQFESQLQPETLRQAQMTTQTQSAIQPETIRQAQIATGTAGSLGATAAIGTQSAQFAFDKSKSDALMNIIGGYRNDPRVASGDPDKAVDAIDEIKKQARALGIPPSVMERISAQAMSIALNQPKALPQYFDNVIQSQLGAQGQQNLQTGSVVTIGDQPGLYRPATRTIEPITFGAPAPSPQAGANVPPPVGVTGADMTAKIGDQSGRLPLQYPVPQAGQPRPVLPQEVFDRDAGSKFRNGLVQQQSQLVTARRNLQEVVRTADKLLKESILPETGAIGAAKRGFATFIGDPTYKQLSKDLANVQISTIQAMGGSLSTDSGKELTRMATGDETFPPEVLLSIARRADADMTNLDMMASGLQKHSQLYGDANTKRYQQMWASNADSRIFELMNIARDIKDEKTRMAMSNKLLGGLNEQQRQQLTKQYQNILKLSKTGEL
jgi:hypothetical protein